jgi:hypothetical protein
LGLGFLLIDGSPFDYGGGAFLSMPPNPPKGHSEAYSSK